MKLSDKARTRIVLLAQYGFHGKYIQAQVSERDGFDISVNVVYAVATAFGVSLRDYRNGESTMVKAVQADVATRLTKKRKAAG